MTRYSASFSTILRQHKPAFRDDEEVKCTSLVEMFTGNILLNPGTILYSSSHAQYRILKCLGGGCSGNVYKCAINDGKFCAVKVVAKYKAKHEMEVLEKLKSACAHHWNVVEYIEAFPWKENMCMVFEYLGENLSDIIKRDGKLTLPQIRPILLQVLIAFTKLKLLGISHNDLTAENVAVFTDQKFCRDFRVKVLDFGNATCYDSLSTNSSKKPCSYSGSCMVGKLVAELFAGRVENYRYTSCQELALQILRHIENECCNAKSDDKERTHDHSDLITFTELMKQILTADTTLPFDAQHFISHEFISMAHLQNKQYYDKSVQNMVDSAERVKRLFETNSASSGEKSYQEIENIIDQIIQLNA